MALPDHLLPTRSGYSFHGYYEKDGGDGFDPGDCYVDKHGSFILDSDGVPSLATASTGGFTIYARWGPVIDVDVPIEASFGLTVDWDRGSVGVEAAYGGGYAMGRFSSHGPAKVRVLSIEQQVGTAAERRASAFGWFARGEAARADNLSKVKLLVSADMDGSPVASSTSERLYAGGAD